MLLFLSCSNELKIPVALYATQYNQLKETGSVSSFTATRSRRTGAKAVFEEPDFTPVRKSAKVLVSFLFF